MGSKVRYSMSFLPTIRVQNHKLQNLRNCEVLVIRTYYVPQCSFLSLQASRGWAGDLTSTAPLAGSRVRLPWVLRDCEESATTLFPTDQKKIVPVGCVLLTQSSIIAAYSGTAPEVFSTVFYDLNNVPSPFNARNSTRGFPPDST